MGLFVSGLNLTEDRSGLHPAPPVPKLEEDDSEGLAAAAVLDQSAVPGPSGRWGQHSVFGFCGPQSLLLHCDWPQ